MPPVVLVGRFGPSGRGTDDGKVSGYCRFTNSASDVFSFYDYKETTRYYGEAIEREWPTPEEFWAGSEPVELSIGGCGVENDDGLNPTATAFREWLQKQWRGYVSGGVN